jgi:RNA polymerase sigma-70 factor (ECF subfamily)
MSHAQIAEELDVPLGTVKSRIRDGMMKMRSMLEGGR